MNKISFILLMVTLVCLSCKTEKENKEGQIKTEILNLTTDEAKQNYLEIIYTADQNVRGTEGQELMLQYGRNSKEYKGYIQKQWDQDEINLYKVETYLEINGYPDKTLGSIATSTPWVVIHHAQGYDTRERNFKTIYKAFLDGNIDDGSISFYLGRMYQIKFRERFDMESPFTSEEELRELINRLDLNEMRNEVEEEFKSLNDTTDL